MQHQHQELSPRSEIKRQLSQGKFDAFFELVPKCADSWQVSSVFEAAIEVALKLNNTAVLRRMAEFCLQQTAGPAENALLKDYRLSEIFGRIVSGLMQLGATDAAIAIVMIYPETKYTHQHPLLLLLNSLFDQDNILYIERLFRYLPDCHDKVSIANRLAQYHKAQNHLAAYFKWLDMSFCMSDQVNNAPLDPAAVVQFATSHFDDFCVYWVRMSATKTSLTVSTQLMLDLVCAGKQRQALQLARHLPKAHEWLLGVVELSEADDLSLLDQFTYHAKLRRFVVTELARRMKGDPAGIRRVLATAKKYYQDDQFVVQAALQSADYLTVLTFLPELSRYDQLSVLKQMAEQDSAAVYRVVVDFLSTLCDFPLISREREIIEVVALLPLQQVAAEKAGYLAKLRQESQQKYSNAHDVHEQSANYPGICSAVRYFVQFDAPEDALILIKKIRAKNYRDKLCLSVAEQFLASNEIDYALSFLAFLSDKSLLNSISGFLRAYQSGDVSGALKAMQKANCIPHLPSSMLINVIENFLQAHPEQALNVLKGQGQFATLKQVSRVWYQYETTVINAIVVSTAVPSKLVGKVISAKVEAQHRFTQTVFEVLNANGLWSSMVRLANQYSEKRYAMQEYEYPKSIRKHFKGAIVAADDFGKKHAALMQLHLSGLRNRLLRELHHAYLARYERLATKQVKKLDDTVRVNILSEIAIKATMNGNDRLYVECAQFLPNTDVLTQIHHAYVAQDLQQVCSLYLAAEQQDFFDGYRFSALKDKALEEFLTQYTLSELCEFAHSLRSKWPPYQEHSDMPSGFYQTMWLIERLFARAIQYCHQQVPEELPVLLQRFEVIFDNGAHTWKQAVDVYLSKLAEQDNFQAREAFIRQLAMPQLYWRQSFLLYLKMQRYALAYEVLMSELQDVESYSYQVTQLAQHYFDEGELETALKVMRLLKHDRFYHPYTTIHQWVVALLRQDEIELAKQVFAEFLVHADSELVAVAIESGRLRLAEEWIEDSRCEPSEKLALQIQLYEKNIGYLRQLVGDELANKLRSYRADYMRLETAKDDLTQEVYLSKRNAMLAALYNQLNKAFMSFYKQHFGEVPDHGHNKKNISFPMVPRLDGASIEDKLLSFYRWLEMEDFPVRFPQLHQCVLDSQPLTHPEFEWLAKLRHLAGVDRHEDRDINALPDGFVVRAISGITELIVKVYRLGDLCPDPAVPYLPGYALRMPASFFHQSPANVAQNGSAAGQQLDGPALEF